MSASSAMRQWPPSKSCLTDLPEELLTSILKHLPLKTKCQAQAVCWKFRDILWKPSKGSFIWDLIQVDDPIFEAASPTALASWLTQRASGIRALHYAPGESLKRSGPELARAHEIVRSVLPQLPALLPSSAEIQLNLSYAPVEPLLESEDPALTPFPGAHAVQPHWTALASSLTELRLSYGRDVGHATTSALQELTRLQCLILCGSRSKTGTYPRARIELSLPQLRTLVVGFFTHVSVLLNCPQLELLGLVSLHPIEALQCISHTVERVALSYLGEGSRFPQEISRGLMLEHLTFLDFVGKPEIFQDPEALEVLKRVFRNGRLQHLTTNCPLEKLTPLDGNRCALPISLRGLVLHLPLEKGLPVVLERLTNLTRLTVYNTGEGPLHLNRCLDPFLNMTGLECLTFYGKPERLGHSVVRPLDLTPDASKFLGLASKRIEEGGLLPHGRAVVLQY